MAIFVTQKRGGKKSEEKKEGDLHWQDNWLPCSQLYISVEVACKKGKGGGTRGGGKGMKLRYFPPKI